MIHKIMRLSIIFFCLIAATQQCHAEHLMPYVHNNRFYNYPGEETKKSHILEEVYMFMHGKILQWLAADSRNPEFADIKNWRMKGKPKLNSVDPIITWVGHATFLIQLGGINILTDPIFGDACRFLYPRIMPPGIAPQNLPPIDVILISHNHWDHLCCDSLKLLQQPYDPIYLVPQGDKSWFKSQGFNDTHHYLWWEQQTIELPNTDHELITFTFLPAVHWSYGSLFTNNKSLWGSWMIEYKGFKIYFAGDTAYGKHFKQIAQEFPGINVALMPIGPCEYREWFKESHVSAQEAIQAFLDLKAQHFIPMHWGAFNFGIDYLTTPIERLIIDWYYHSAELSTTELHLVKAGQEELFKFPTITPIN